MTLPRYCRYRSDSRYGSRCQRDIYERILEEQRAGKGLRLAIEDGFKNAYSAIIDGNVTTLITAIILFIFGSGPYSRFRNYSYHRSCIFLVYCNPDLQEDWSLTGCWIPTVRLISIINSLVMFLLMLTLTLLVLESMLISSRSCFCYRSCNIGVKWFKLWRWLYRW